MPNPTTSVTPTTIMDTQTQAHLYLADQRGCSQLDYFRSYHSFNFGPYRAEGREPFGALHLLNDEVVRPGHGVRMQVDEATDVLILPITGGLEYTSSVGDGFIDVGQAGRFSLASGMFYEVINPYETEFINYIVLWFTHPATGDDLPIRQVTFDLQRKNDLLPLDESEVFRAFIGRYDGRTDGLYPLMDAGGGATNGVFVFVLSGAFEVQDRLLHERDGLALLSPQDHRVAFEALSNDALLLLLDVRLVA